MEIRAEARVAIIRTRVKKLHLSVKSHANSGNSFDSILVKGAGPASNHEIETPVLCYLSYKTVCYGM